QRRNADRRGEELMSVSRPFTLRRRARWARPWAMALIVAMALMTNGGPQFLTTVVNAQQQTAPVSQGFHLDAEDLRFIFHAIEVSQDHAAGGELRGTGPNQGSDPQLPLGLRTADGSVHKPRRRQEK